VSSYGWIAEGFEGRADLRVFVCYHHLMPIPGTGRERIFDTGRGSAARTCSFIFALRRSVEDPANAGENQRGYDDRCDDDRLKRNGS
jgi:hypothetical protein